MEDSSFHTPCWRHWVNRQKVSSVRDMSWDDLHELWTEAFGAAERRAPPNTSLAEIERNLYRFACDSTPTPTRATSGARLSAPTTAFDDRFYSRSKLS